MNRKFVCINVVVLLSGCVKLQESEGSIVFESTVAPRQDVLITEKPSLEKTASPEKTLVPYLQDDEMTGCTSARNNTLHEEMLPQVLVQKSNNAPQQEKVWIVDRSAWSEKIVEADAWTEEVKKLITPEYMKEIIVEPAYDITICNVCGMEFAGTGQIGDCVEHQVALGHNGYHTITVPPKVEYEVVEAVYHTEYIEHPEKFRIEKHPEEGHWEFR